MACPTATKSLMMVVRGISISAASVEALTFQGRLGAVHSPSITGQAIARQARSGLVPAVSQKARTIGASPG